MSVDVLLVFVVEPDIHQKLAGSQALGQLHLVINHVFVVLYMLKLINTRESSMAANNDHIIEALSMNLLLSK